MRHSKRVKVTHLQHRQELAKRGARFDRDGAGVALAMQAFGVPEHAAQQTQAMSAFTKREPLAQRADTPVTLGNGALEARIARVQEAVVEHQRRQRAQLDH